MQTKEKFGLSINQFVFSMMLVVLGGLTYYVAPTAFLYQQFSIFFGILNFILLIMILGMTFIATLLLPYVQMLILNLFMCCCKKDRILKPVIAKNFEAHESRNTKTAVMFTLALSFVVFAGAAFQLIGRLVVSEL
jgi:hypothetical protein